MNDLTKNTPSTQFQDDDEIDLRELMGTVLSGKWLILFFTILFMLLAIVYAYSISPIYQGDSLLQVESQKAGIPGLEELIGLEKKVASVGTEVEIIKSRKILGQAVEKHKLDITAQPRRIRALGNIYRRVFKPLGIEKPNFFWDKLNTYFHPYAWGNESISVDRLSVPDDLLNSSLELIARDNNEYEIFFDDQLLLNGKVNQAASSNDGNIKLFVADLKALPGTIFDLTKLSKLDATWILQDGIQAYEIGDNTGIIRLTLQEANKQLIVKTLDSISNTYLEQNKSRSSEEASNALKFLNEQIKSVKETAELAEARLLQYRTSNQTADLSMETQTVLTVVSDIETELQKFSLKRNELRQKYTPNHPIMQSLRSQEVELEKRRADTLLKVAKLPETQQQLIKLEADYKVSNAVYIDLLNNIQEFKIAKASNVGNVYIIDSAVVSEIPISPNRSRIVAIGALLGAMLGTLLVFLLKALRHYVDNPEKIEEKFGLPVYATVPFSKGVNLTRGFKKDKKKQKSLLALDDETDLAIESLRSLRTSLHFALLEAKNNIVMLTGPSPNTGKSFISSNLSAVIAASEQRVLLIDADMRKGYLHSIFNRKTSPGLSDLISEKCTLEEAIQTIQIADKSMDVIFRGQTPPNPSELLMHSNFEKILAVVSEKYDLVIIDTPPIHAVTDPTIIGRHAGVVFMVVYSNRHSMKEIEHAVSHLSRAGINTKGFIFNGYVAKSSLYGYGYGSYYGEYK